MKKITILAALVLSNLVGRALGRIKTAQDSAYIQRYTKIPPKPMAFA